MSKPDTTSWQAARHAGNLDGPPDCVIVPERAGGVSEGTVRESSRAC